MLLIITIPLLLLLILLHQLRNNYLLFTSICIYNRCILMLSFLRLLVDIVIGDDSSYFERRLLALSPEFSYHLYSLLTSRNATRTP